MTSLDFYHLSKLHIIELVKRIYKKCNVKINYGTRYTKVHMITSLLRFQCSLRALTRRTNSRLFVFHSTKLDLEAYYGPHRGWYFPERKAAPIMEFDD